MAYLISSEKYVSVHLPKGLIKPFFSLYVDKKGL